MRASAACAIALAVVTAGCRRDPNLTYAHLLERAASWTASVQFAGELADRGLVPRTYLRDVLSTASDEMNSLRSQISDFDGASPADRSKDAETCARLATLLRAAETGGSVPDLPQLRDAEHQLRRDAQRLRGSMRLETRR